MSSSDDQTVIAVARRPVGIDIECVRSDIEGLSIAKRLFSHVECTHLQKIPTNQKRKEFFRIWVRKEAFAKAIGLGFGRDFPSFDTLPADDRSAKTDQALIVDRAPSEEGDRWLVRDVPARAGFAMACCAEGEHWSVVLFNGTDPP